MLPDVWKQHIQEQRLDRDEQKLTRKLRSLRHLDATRVQAGSREFVNFSSNDYLGLTSDLRIVEAAASAAGRYGWGAGASRLVSGTSTLHTKLESEIAQFRGTESALLYGSGYQANLGVITALAGKGDTVLSDRRNHASIVDACRMSGSMIKIFNHRDHNDLERRMNNVRDGRMIVVTDSLFSVDGDMAELRPIVKLCDRFGALLIVDDAHANGALGKSGRGVPEIQEVVKNIPVVVGTFSKTLASYGGFVACDAALRDFLVNHSRAFIYTTAMPIALAAANIEALKILRKDGEALRQKLAANVSALRSRLEGHEFELTGDRHIVGVRVNGPEAAVMMGEEVELKGILVQPMRYPTTPRGDECLRVSVSAAHTPENLTRLVHALRDARDTIVQKKTSNVSRREAKRPTHRELEIAEMPAPDFDGMGMDMADHPAGTTMSAVDSQRMPEVDGAGDESGMFVQPVDDTPDAMESIEETAEEDAVDHTDLQDLTASEDEPEPVDAEIAASKDTGSYEIVPETEEPVEESASDNGEPELKSDEAHDKDGDGNTLAPEPVELEDPVIAEIESGTRKHKKKKKKKSSKKSGNKK